MRDDTLTLAEYIDAGRRRPKLVGYRVVTPFGTGRVAVAWDGVTRIRLVQRRGTYAAHAGRGQRTTWWDASLATPTQRGARGVSLRQVSVRGTDLGCHLTFPLDNRKVSP